jgi:hypothetical protein
MERMQRFWYLALGVGLTVMGVFIAFEDKTGPGTGIFMVVGGLFVTGAMSYLMFGGPPKPGRSPKKDVEP